MTTVSVGPEKSLKSLCQHKHICLLFTVTPAHYQPPGFKEGECDSLWFEGKAVHFRVGEVQTAFHTLKVRVSAKEDRLKKLQEGQQLNGTVQASQGDLPSSKRSEVG